eukprot:4436290-Prorocentrum_lima.AAC.1
MSTESAPCLCSKGWHVRARWCACIEAACKAGTPRRLCYLTGAREYNETCSSCVPVGIEAKAARLMKTATSSTELQSKHSQMVESLGAGA